MLSEKNNKIQRNFKENYHVDFMIEEEMNYTKEEIEQIKSM